MIIPPPPAIHYDITLDEDAYRPRGASEESDVLAASATSVLRTLLSTPRQTAEISDDETISEDLDDYVSPQPKRVRTVRVRVRHIGPAKPLPYDFDEDLD